MTPAPSPKNRDQHHSGSPKSGEPVYLTIGKLRRTHGVKGNLLMDVLGDSAESIAPGLVVFVGPKHKEARVAEVRPNNNSLLIRFEGITDCDQAAVFRNQAVAIRSKEAPPLPEGRYYQHEVLGLRVIDETAKELGVLTEILSTGAHDVYVIKPAEGEEILVPAVKDFILKIDTEGGVIVARLPQWE